MSLLQEAKNNTINFRIKESAYKVTSALKDVIDLIKSRSLNGYDYCLIELSILKIGVHEAEQLIVHPSLTGFICSVEKTFITDDSSSVCGGYNADCLKISWK
jgi:hypothetical protein